jgi:hypothetical protein
MTPVICFFKVSFPQMPVYQLTMVLSLHTYRKKQDVMAVFWIRCTVPVAGGYTSSKRCFTIETLMRKASIPENPLTPVPSLLLFLILQDQSLD